MRVIDAHVHVIDDYPAMSPYSDAGRVDRLLFQMDRCGVEKALMLPVVAAASPDNNRQCADWARQHPDRLAALTDVQLHEPDAADRVLAVREKFGAAGTSYYPSTSDLAWMLESSCDRLWEAFEQSKLVCNLQVAPPNYGVMIELASRHPDVTFVMNHLGLPKALEADDASYGGLMAAADLANVFVKASAFYASAATPWDFRCPQALGRLTQLVAGLGADRVLFGTDWPPASGHLTYLQAVEIVRTFGDLDDDARARVLGENAARVFGI